MLYFIATPIGNLKDISFRAVEKLNEVDVIACEDTRKSLILLNHYNIKKRLITYNKDNEKNSADGIIKMLKEGQNVAVISDSGMPVISDPGSFLIEKLKQNLLEYTIIPGANAALSAVVLSGISAAKFAFVGFLPEKNKDRDDTLNSLKNLSLTLVFYVAPHNLEKDVAHIFKIFGDRKACLVNEITKLFEKVISFNLKGFSSLEIQPKGEYVLVVEGAEENCASALTDLSINEQISFYIDMGLSKKEALKKVAKENKIKNIYKVLEEN